MVRPEKRQPAFVEDPGPPRPRFSHRQRSVNHCRICNMHRTACMVRSPVMILVVGATGMLGSVIARRLLEQQKEVRILVREGSEYRALAAAGAEPVIGDLKNRASL